MHRLLLQVFRGTWMIEPRTALSSHFAIKSLLDGKLVFEADKDSFKPILINSASLNRVALGGNHSQNVNTGVVAVIPIKGVLLKDDQDCGPVGMDSLGDYIKRMDDNAEVDAIMLNIDSPGGTVSGTAQLASIIQNTKKPIVAFVDDLAASAAYWLASNCDLIIASTKMAEVGSIGVMTSYADVQPMWEKEGVVFHDIYADGSENKNQDTKDIRAKKYQDYKDRVLNPLREEFVSTVKVARKGKIKDETVFDGHVEFADNAIKSGLIDRIASFDEAIDITLGLVTTKPTAKVEIPKPKSLSMNKYTRTAAVVGVPSFEVDADGCITLQEENIVAIEAALESAEGNRTALEQHAEQATAVQATIDGHLATITERDATIAQLNADIAALRGAAGADTAIASAANDPEKVVAGDPLMAKINATSDPVERMNLMREAGYTKK